MLQCTNCGLHLTAKQEESGACPNCQTPVAVIRAGAEQHQTPVSTMDPGQHLAQLQDASGDQAARPRELATSTHVAPSPPNPQKTFRAKLPGQTTNRAEVGDTVVLNMPSGPTPPAQTMVAHGSKAVHGTDSAQQMWQAVADSAASPMMTVKTEEMNLGREQQLVIHRRTLRPKEQDKSDDADYQLLRFLGEGGMGTVYVAHQGSVQREVAIKMLKPELSKNIADRRKFLYEAHITGDLDHPHIVPIHDLGISDDGTLFYSMKLVDGTPWLESMNSKSRSENLAILMQVCDAVSFAHSRNVIHRDIKPENVMLGTYGEVVLMDWGLAVDMTHGARFVLGGTPAYMSPEMARHEIEMIDKSSDVYLLGASLFHVVTGNPPHPGTTVAACVGAAAKNVILDANESDELVAIALKAMGDRPDQRFDSVGAFQDAIRQYQSHAESIVMVERAFEDLGESKSESGYESLQRSVFGFQEALELWPENHRAADGLQQAQTAYAERALVNEDFDLGLSLVSAESEEHEQLYRQLLQGNEERSSRVRRLKVAKRSAAGLGLIALAVSLVGLVAFDYQRRDAIGQAKLAKEAEGKERLAKNEATDALGQAKAAAASEKIARDAADAAAAEAKAAAASEKIARDAADAAAAEAKAAAAREKIAADAERLAKEEASTNAKRAQLNVYQSQVLYAGALVDQAKVSAALRYMTQLTQGREGELDAADYAGWELFRLYELANFETPRQIMPLDENNLTTLFCTTPNTEKLACSVGNQVLVFDRAADSVSSWSVEGGVLAMQFLNSGSRMVIGTASGDISLWDASTGQQLSSTNAMRSLFHMRVLGNERQIVTVGDDGANVGIKFWNISGGSVEQDTSQSPSRGVRLVAGNKSQIASVHSSPSGQTFVVQRTDQENLLAFRFSEKKGNPAAPYIDPFLETSIPVATHLLPDPDRPELRWYATTADGNLFELNLSGTSVGELTPIPAHDGEIRHLATGDLRVQNNVAPVLVTCGGDATLRIYDRTSLRMKESLIGHRSAVIGCAIEDQNTLVSLDANGEFRRWNLLESHEVTLEHPGTPSTADFSSISTSTDDRVVVAGDDHGALHAWSQSAPYVFNPLAVFPGPGHDRGQPLAIKVIGNQIISRSRNGTMLMWDAETGTLTRRLENKGWGESFVVNATRHLIATYDTPARQNVLIWDLANSASPVMSAYVTAASGGRDASGLRAIEHFAMSADGRLLITGVSGAGLAVWDISGQTAKPIWRQPVFDVQNSETQLYQDWRIDSLEWLPQSNRLLATLSDKQSGRFVVDVWEGLLATSPPRIHSQRLFSEVRPAAGLRQISADDRGITALVQAGDHVQVYFSRFDGGAISDAGRSAQHSIKPTEQAFLSANGSVVLLVDDESVSQWDFVGDQTSQISALPDQLQRSITSATSRVKTQFTESATSGFLYRADAGEFWIASLDGANQMHSRAQPKVLRAQVSQDGTHALVHYDDGRLWYWNLSETGQVDLVPQLQLPGLYRDGALSPSGNELAVVSIEGATSILHLAGEEPQRAQPLQEPPSELARVSTIAWSPDGTQIAGGTEAGHLVLWNVANLQLQQATEKLHTQPVRRIIWSKERSLLASVDQGGNVRVWSNSDPLHSVLIQDANDVIDNALDIGFSPDGTRLLIGKSDGSANVFLMDFENNVIPEDPKTAQMRVQRVFNLVTAKGEDSVLSSRFSDDGRSILTSTQDKAEVRVWKTRRWPGQQ